MTQRLTPATELHTGPHGHAPIGMTDYGGTGAPPPDRAASSTPPLTRASGHVYEFQIASNGAHYRVELLRVTVTFFGRARLEFVGVTDGPFDIRADAEAALARRWDEYRRATSPS